VLAYKERIRRLIEQVVREGREAGEFERKTPLDETVNAIGLVIYPYVDPLQLQYNLEQASEATTRLSSLVLRSLAP
jgi:hypothetical protein